MLPWFDSSRHNAVRAITAHDAGEALNLAQRSANDLAELRARVDRLETACRAMWTLLKVQSGRTDADLVKEIEAIDLHASQAAERQAGEHALECESCGKKVSRIQKACIYCGGNVRVPPGAKPIG